MGRKRLAIGEKKERISIRLPKSLIDKIEQKGTKQQVIQSIVEQNIDKYK